MVVVVVMVMVVVVTAFVRVAIVIVVQATLVKAASARGLIILGHARPDHAGHWTRSGEK